MPGAALGASPLGAPLLVVLVPLVVSVTDGRPMSVVDSGTLVVNDVVGLSEGVITKGCFSRDVVVGSAAVVVVIRTVVTGLLH